MNGMVRDPVLAGYLEQVETIRDAAGSLAHDLTAQQLNWRPDQRRWSIGQCMQHVTMTVALYPAKVEAMLAEARERMQRGEKPYREGAFSRWFVRSMEPPPKMRTRAMRKVDPAPDLDPEQVVRDFDAAHAQLASWIAAADGLSLVHGRTASPFVPVLRFTLGQVFALNLAHARRHLWQARQVRQDPGFPQG